MLTEQEKNPVPDSDCLLRSRKINRRTLKGLVTQVERIQQQLRNVGMQYSEAKPEVMRALSLLHDSLDNNKDFIVKVANML